MKTIEDLKNILKAQQSIYRDAITTSPDQIVRNVCYGKLDIVNEVLDFLEENKL